MQVGLVLAARDVIMQAPPDTDWRYVGRCSEANC